MDIRQSSYIKEWKKENRKMLRRMHPDIPRKDVNEFLDKEIKKYLKNPECQIHNNYIHKSIKTDLLSVIDWIKKTKCICGGHGVFYKNQFQVKNLLASMIIKFLDSRAAFKGELKHIKDKESYEYKTFDRKQLSEKIMANSIYGCLGMIASFIFNRYVAPSVTGTGQSLISTTCCAFENFMANNVAFNNVNEFITFINNVTSEEYTLDDDFLENVTAEQVFIRMRDKFYDWDDDNSDLVIDTISALTQEELNHVYYKNNLYEFSRLEPIKEILINIVHYTDEFKDPNSIPKLTQKYTDELWEYYSEFVFYNYSPINRIHRLKNDVRKCVLTIDTDSNMLNLNPWVEFMSEEIIPCDKVASAKDKETLRFISINTMAFVVTSVVKAVLAKYTSGANIPKEYRHYINMKNEFLFSKMILASVKKRYITSVRLREGDEIYPEKIDTKGFDYVKSSTTAETKAFYEGIVKHRIIEPDEIQISEIFRDMEHLEGDITTSLQNGEKKYLSPANAKEVAAYKDPLSEQSIRGVIAWNSIYPDMTIDLPAKVDLVKLTLNNDKDLNRLADEYPEIYSVVEKQILNSNVPKIAEKKLAVIAIPKNVKVIPEWILGFIDYGTISTDVLRKFYPVLESLGLETLHSTKKDYFSNIVDFK